MLKNKLVKLLSAIFFVVNININDINSQRLCNRRYLNDKIRIDGKVVIVTGGTSGLGFETARNLADRGGRIYITSRGEKRGTEAVETLKRMTGNRNVKFNQLDLGVLKSVRQFSETFQFNKTEDGFEVNMGVNYLGPFLLTNLLLDLLKASAPSRILVVSSILHYRGIIIRNNLNSEIYFPGSFKAYGNSKLANVIFTRELSRRLENTGVTVNSLDPGNSMSTIAQYLQPILRLYVEHLQHLYGRNPEHGSQTHVMLSIDPSVKDVSGKYFRDCEQEEPAYFAIDDNLGLWLWDESVKLTNCMNIIDA